VSHLCNKRTKIGHLAEPDDNQTSNPLVQKRLQLSVSIGTG